MNTETTKAELTPEALFAYASDFAKRAEKAGKGTQYPTYRQCAKRFGVKIDDVETACEDWVGNGYMRPVVAFSIGSGVATIDKKGDYQVEAYR